MFTSDWAKFDYRLHIKAWAINWGLVISAVSYLNTWPLVWGFLHGPQKGLYDFRFDLPAQCADAVDAGAAEIGLVPAAELDRLELDFLPELGIACEGPVRSILLISRKPFAQIKTLAVDASSRTSVALARILLAERFGCTPRLTARKPVLHDMLAECDAALIIGDPALRIDPTSLPYAFMDLGAEWVDWTELPMVFAVWAGKSRFLTADLAAAMRGSYEWGCAHMAEMCEAAKTERGFRTALAHEYFTRHIAYELSPRHLEGLTRFRAFVRDLDRVGASAV
jgi:chorismate dehydratase